MPGAVLRISGRKNAVSRFLAKTSWKPLTVYWKHAPRLKSSTRTSAVNGFNVSVSAARGVDLSGQIRDARRFLRRYAGELRRMNQLRLSGVLDFGVEVQHEGGPAYFRFRHELIADLAMYGIELEVSYYGKASE
ncbi:MAG: hypothetical protein JO203_00295 [Gammaproteobacteria bacterium]|nr:hypothetical protein [Gammaproteobacteria bacterium]